MDFSPPIRRPRGESIVPMINVVFLLLIFFLMTAQISPPAPLDVTPPEAEADPVERRADTLYINADSALAFNDARGDGVFAALGARDASDPLPIRADAALDASELTRLLPRLAAIGITDITLITAAP